MDSGEKYAACTEGLRGFMGAAGFTDCVLGLSGGIDSALVACMAADALGAQRVHGVRLPGPYSTQHSLDDAQDLAKRLHIDLQTVSIATPCAAFLEALDWEAGGAAGAVALAEQNIQARSRMVVLMALSNAHGWLLLNCGNKSEAAMGYCTLYGDAAGAYAPLAPLYKTEVYELARWRNAQARQAGETEPLPQHILEKAPSAELAPGQTDEASLGLSYAEIDAILRGLQDEGRTPEQLAAVGFSPAAIAKVQRSFAAAAFKRAALPPGPVL